MNSRRICLCCCIALLLGGCTLSNNDKVKKNNNVPQISVPEEIVPGTLFEKQFSKLKAQPMLSGDNFDFAICGDTQFGETFQYKPETYQIINDWNVWRPTLAFDMGDLIFGGSAEGVTQQWAIYDKTWVPLQVPFFTLVGGHDVSDKATEDLYKNHIGPIMYSLNYGNCNFITLDTEENGQAPGVLSDGQIEWLKKALSESKASNIFIMMHQPIFDSEAYPGSSWSKIAQIIKPYPVKAVLAGHKHYYRDYGIIDGTRYIISGGGGGDRTGTPEEKGGFAHYLWVQIRGDNVNFIVVKPGSVFPVDTVTKARVKEMEELPKLIATEKVKIPYGETLDRDVTVFVENPYDWPLNLDLKWTIPSGWHVTPDTLRIEAKPKQKATAKVHIKTDGPDAVRFPVPYFKTVVPKVKNGGPINVTSKLDLIQIGYAVTAPENMSLDGNLEKWQNAKRIELIYPYGFDPKDTKDLSSKISFMWDAKNLYVLLDTIDDVYYQPYSGDIVWSADSVELFMGPWHWELSLTPKGNEVFLSEAPAGREIELLNDVVKLKVTRLTDTHIIYEAAFPLSEIAPLKLEKGKSFDYTVIMNDLDPKKSYGRHWLEATPGWGEFTYGPKAKIVLIK